MANVANDVPTGVAQLPASGADSHVSGIPLRLIAGLAERRGGVVHAAPTRLEVSVDRAAALRVAHDGFVDLRHQLVIADAATLLHACVDVSHRMGLVARLAEAGAVGLVVGQAPTGEPGEPGEPDRPDRPDRPDGTDADLRDAARVCHLPLIELPEEQLPRFTTEVLEAILEHQTSMLRRLDDADRALVQIVLAGGSLDDLCERVGGFLDGAVMVTTTDGRIIAAAGSPLERDHAASLPCFDRSGRLLTESEPIGARPDGPTAGRVAVRIAAGPFDHGLLVAFCSHRSLTVDDVHLLERAATVAALAITKDQAVAAVESKYRAEFLRDALAGRAGSVADAVAHAQSLGWHIDRPMVVVVAETDEDDEQSSRDAEEVRFLQERFARAWTHAMAVRESRSPVMGFSREVVALVGVPAEADTDRVMRSVHDLVRVVRGDGGGGRRSFSAGVSRTITSPAGLPQAYAEAQSAVTVGRQLHGHGALTHVDGLGIYRLLGLVPDSADLRRFVAETLGPLATDDQAENSDLRRTLGLLIDTNLNVAETARRLFFHYNTLRYRIGKLEKLLGPFTTDPELRLALALALKVHRMRGL